MPPRSRPLRSFSRAVVSASVVAVVLAACSSEYAPLTPLADSPDANAAGGRSSSSSGAAGGLPDARPVDAGMDASTSASSTSSSSGQAPDAAAPLPVLTLTGWRGYYNSGATRDSVVLGTTTSNFVVEPPLADGALAGVYARLYITDGFVGPVDLSQLRLDDLGPFQLEPPTNYIDPTRPSFIPARGVLDIHEVQTPTDFSARGRLRASYRDIVLVELTYDAAGTVSVLPGGRSLAVADGFVDVSP